MKIYIWRIKASTQNFARSQLRIHRSLPRKSRLWRFDTTQLADIFQITLVSLQIDEWGGDFTSNIYSGLQTTPGCCCFLRPVIHDGCVKGKKEQFINPFTATACQISGLECAHIHAWKQYIWRFYNKSTFSIVHFERNHFTCLCERRKKR